MSPDLHHLSGAYAVDALGSEERAAFEQHLAACESCRAEVAELSATAHELAALTDATPPPALREAVLGGIGRVRPLPPLGPDDTSATDGPGGPGSPVVGTGEPLAGEAGAAAVGARVVPLLRRPLTWVAAAAAAAVLAVGGVVWSPWSTDRPALTAVEQVQQAADATTVTAQDDGRTATLAYSRVLDRSALTVTGMPRLEPGEVYQLWYIGADGARPAGFLTAGDDGRGQAALDGSLEGADQVGVTVEPDGGSAQPTTQPVLVVAVA